MAKVETLTLKVDAETKAAAKAIAGLEKQLDGLDDAKIKVKADTKSAERDIKDLSRSLDDLDDTEFSVDADTRDAAGNIDDLLDSVDKLDSADATIELKLAEANLGAQLEAIRSDVEKLDADDATIDIKMEQGDKIIADIDQIQSKLKEIDDLKVTPEVDTGDSLGRARRSTDELTDSAKKARNASANMWGNAAQDLGAFAGIAGSAGVALGQLAEGAADARNDGEGLGSVFKGLAGSALPILGLSVAVGLVGKAFASWKASQGEAAKNIKAINTALNESIGVLDDYQHAIESAFGTGTANTLAVFSESMFQALDKISPDKVTALTTALGELGLVRIDFGDQLLQSTEQFAKFNEERLRAAGIDDEEAAKIGQLIAQYGDFNTVAGVAAANSATLGEGTIETIEANEGLIRTLTAVSDAYVTLNKNSSAAAQAFLNQQASVNEGSRAMVDQAIESATRVFHTTSGAVISQVDWNAAIEEFIRLQQEAAQKSQTLTDAHERQLAMQEKNRALLAEARAETDRMTFTQEELNDAIQAGADPMKTMSDQWAALINDFRDGDFDLEGALGSINAIAKATGQEPGAIFEIIKEQAAAANTAVDEANKAVEELARTLASSTFEINTPEFRGGAISTVFDQLDELSRLDTSDQLTDIVDAFDAIDQAARDFPQSIVGFDLIPDNWEEVKNMPDDLKGITDAIGGFRDSVQTQLAEAFEFGGPEALRAAASDITTQFEEPFRAMMARNGASVEETNEAWNQFLQDVGLAPENIEMTVTLAIDQQKLQVLKDIASGAGLEGEQKLNFDIAISNNDPETALAILNAQLAGVGQEVTITYNAETGQVETALVPLENPAPVTVPVNTTTDTSEATGALAPVGEPIAVPVATEAPDTTKTDSFFSTLFATPATKEVQLVAKSDSLGAIAKLLDAVANKKRTAKIDVKAPEADDIDDDLTAIAHKTRTAKIDVTAPKADDVSDDLDDVAEERDADIRAQATNVGPTDATLDGLAMPSEDGRIAHIFALASNIGAVDAALDAVAAIRIAQMNVKADNAGQINRILDEVARDRTADIFVVRHDSGGGTSGGKVTDNSRAVTPSATTTAVAPTQVMMGAPAPVVVQTPAPIHANVTIKTAAIGSRYDVMRVVTAATRNGIRLGARSLARTGG